MFKKSVKKRIHTKAEDKREGLGDVRIKKEKKIHENRKEKSKEQKHSKIPGKNRC